MMITDAPLPEAVSDLMHGKVLIVTLADGRCAEVWRLHDYFVLFEAGKDRVKWIAIVSANDPVNDGEKIVRELKSWI